MLSFSLTPDSLCRMDFSLCNDSSSDCSVYSMFPAWSLLNCFTLYFSNCNNQNIIAHVSGINNKRQNIPNVEEDALQCHLQMETTKTDGRYAERKINNVNKRGLAPIVERAQDRTIETVWITNPGKRVRSMLAISLPASSERFLRSSSSCVALIPTEPAGRRA